MTSVKEPKVAASTSIYRPAQRFILRASVLPFSLIAECRDAASLRRVIADPVVREAVFVASYDVGNGLAAWLDGPDDPAIERTLTRYLARMAGRATPFGLFSGVCVGTRAETTTLVLRGPDQHRRHTRLDNDYLFALCNTLSADPAISAQLRLVPNTSLYRSAATWRYAEARVEGEVRSYHLVAVDSSDYLDAVLARAVDGATLAELVSVLTADPEIEAQDAETFVLELLATQLLVTELQPPVTGAEPAATIAARLHANPLTEKHAAVLDEVGRQIEAIDASPLGTPDATYRAIASALEALPVEVNPRRLFQTDLYLAGEITLGANVLDEITKGVDLLARLSMQPGERWSKFREAFGTRYETREVPLVELLDEVSGIGFGESPGPSAATPLLADLAFPFRLEAQTVEWSGRTAHVLGLYANAIARGATTIELVQADLDVLASKTPGIASDTVTAMAVVIAESTEAIDAGNFRVELLGLSGGSATRLLGRFCHGSAEITALARELTEIEASRHPDAVLAEVVHLPEGRVGNILIRPMIRDYEIWYLGNGGADADHRIPVTDLTVSVVGDRVVLRSKRLGKEVRPQLGTAHNYSARSLAIYRFLCALATQHDASTSWSWGVLDSAPFLPRVTYGRLVLDRARWLLVRSDLEPLDTATRGTKQKRAPGGEPHAREVSAVAALRDARRLPRWIVVADGDNELPVDLDNPLGVASFVHLVRGRDSVIVRELMPAPDELCTRGPRGAHVHQLVIPYVRSDQPAVQPLPPITTAHRRFPPGSRWLYAKLYGGPPNLEVVLRDALRPLTQELGAGIDRWFFIRYMDPEHHIRIRFEGDPAVLTGELLPRLSESVAQAIDRGLVYRMQLDTYERETERYGGDFGIVPSEELFAADSEAVLAILDAYRGDDGAEAKWRLAVRGCDQLLADLGLTMAERLAVATSQRDGLGAEHGMDTEFQKRLGERFRKHRDELSDLLAAAPDTDHPLAAGIAAFAVRSQRVAPVVATLRSRHASGQIPETIADLSRSYVHMHVNRMLAASQRMQELVIYDLLRRHYAATIARAR